MYHVSAINHCYYYVPFFQDLLATGSRDGNILVWDSRCSSANSPECQAVLRIQAAHAVYDALTPQRKRRRRVVAHNNNQLLTVRTYINKDYLL